MGLGKAQVCPVTGIVCIVPANCPVMCSYDDWDNPTFKPPQPFSIGASVAVWVGMALAVWAVVAVALRFIQ